MSQRRTIARNPPPADDAGAMVAVPVDVLVALQMMMAEMLTRQKATDAELAAIRKAVEPKFVGHGDPINLLGLNEDEITTTQAARIVGVDVATIRNWAKEHAIGKPNPVRNRIIISRAKLMAYLEDRKAKAENAHQKRLRQLPHRASVP